MTDAFRFPHASNTGQVRRSAFLLLDRGAVVLRLSESRCLSHAIGPIRSMPTAEGEIMQDIKTRWLTFYAEHIEQTSKEIFGHVEKMIV